MRKLLTICWLAVILSGICYMFWYHEWKYNLPTPVPMAYQAVNTGERVDIGNRIKSEKGKPLFIHFFNPDCPCSRFNITHFKSLVKKYSNKITFAVVVINKDKVYTDQEIKDKYDLEMQVISDTSIARACGVYSTPQAVLLDEKRDLYYRGNYNRSRYCTDTKSNFAQMALDSLLNNISKPGFNQYALKAYGCQLPYCNR